MQASIPIVFLWVINLNHISDANLRKLLWTQQYLVHCKIQYNQVVLINVVTKLYYGYSQKC